MKVDCSAPAFTAVPSTFIDGGSYVVVLSRYGGAMKDGGAPLDAVDEMTEAYAR